jgi:hypothetical protein
MLNHSRHRQHANLAHVCAAQRPCAGAYCGAGREDIVDQQDRSLGEGCGLTHGEGARHVRASGRGGQTGLRRRPSASHERSRDAAQTGASSQRLGDQRRLVVSALAETSTVERDWNNHRIARKQRGDTRTPQEKLGQPQRHPTPATELELMDESP